jgi:hypothetical protein
MAGRKVRLDEPISKPKVRVQLDLPPHEAVALDAIRDRFDLKSRADAVRTALAVVDWMQGQVAQGRTVLAIGNEDVSYLTLRGLTTQQRPSA